jgi:large subunit ribosomal protein L28
MTRVCQVTGKGPITGNTVSHAKNKTRRRFLPNLHKRRIWVASTNSYVTLKVSANGLRLIDKLGIEVVLERMKKNEIAANDIAN